MKKLIILILSLTLTQSLLAQTNTDTRELFVPFKDLNLLLGEKTERMLISRDEFEKLKKHHQKTKRTKAPITVIPLNANYHLHIDKNIASINGTIEIDVLEKGLHVMPLQVAAIYLQEVQLDNNAAGLYRKNDLEVLLPISGVGKHRLKLKAISPVRSAAGKQTLSFNLPSIQCSSLSATIQGNVSVENAETVISTSYKESTKTTHLELVPKSGIISLNLRHISSNELSKQIIVSNSIHNSFLSESFEKIEDFYQFNVLRGNVKTILFTVPENVKITKVETRYLTNWLIEKKGNQTILKINLLKEIDSPTIVKISAIKTLSSLRSWTFNNITPIAITDHQSIIHLYLSKQLKAKAIRKQQLITISPQKSNFFPQLSHRIILK